MQALVVGASGFVGSALCRALLESGYQVSGLTRTPELAAQRIGKGVTLVRGSVAQPREVAEAARGCDLLFNAAGLAPMAAPARVLRWLHVAGAENVLRAARHARVKRLVHISCADVSLTSEDRMHWDEKRVLPSSPVGLFAQTKLMAEELLLAESNEQLQVVALRPSLLWGPGDIDGVARLAKGVRSGAFRLYNGGRNIVSTTHIENLCKAALLAARAPEAPSRAYYVSDGEFLEARELYQKLLDALGLPMPTLNASLTLDRVRAAIASHLLRDHDARLAELLRQSRSALFDVSRAVGDLGYEPQIDLTSKLSELKSWLSSEGGIDAIVGKARSTPTEADVDEQVRAAGGD